MTDLSYQSLGYFGTLFQKADFEIQNFLKNRPKAQMVFGPPTNARAGPLAYSFSLALHLKYMAYKVPFQYLEGSYVSQDLLGESMTGAGDSYMPFFHFIICLYHRPDARDAMLDLDAQDFSMGWHVYDLVVLYCQRVFMDSSHLVPPWVLASRFAPGVTLLELGRF